MRARETRDGVGGNVGIGAAFGVGESVGVGIAKAQANRQTGSVDDVAQNRIDLHAAPLDAQLLAQRIDKLRAAALGAVGGYPCDHLVQLAVRVRGKGETLRNVRARAALDRCLVPELFGPIRVLRESSPAGHNLAAGAIGCAAGAAAWCVGFAGGVAVEGDARVTAASLRNASAAQSPASA